MWCIGLFYAVFQRSSGIFIMLIQLWISSSKSMLSTTLEWLVSTSSILWSTYIPLFWWLTLSRQSSKTRSNFSLQYREKKILQWDMPNVFNFDFDYQLVYFFYLCASLPNFINTFVYLHRKRAQQLCQARMHAKIDWKFTWIIERIKVYFSQVI